MTLRNGLDPASSERTQLLGFSSTIGLLLSESNGVSRLVHSGTAARDGGLRIGDVLLEVQSPAIPRDLPRSPALSFLL